MISRSHENLLRAASFIRRCDEAMGGMVLEGAPASEVVADLEREAFRVLGMDLVDGALGSRRAPTNVVPLLRERR